MPFLLFSVTNSSIILFSFKIWLVDFHFSFSNISNSFFFDDTVSEFFSPHAADKSTMIAVGVGVPGYESRPGKILAGQLTRTEITQ